MSDEQDDRTEPLAPVSTADLSRETTPPAELEERVVAALAARGQLGASPRRRAGAFAGMAACLAAGLGLGVLLARPEPRNDRFVLLLDASPATPADDGHEAERVKEYSGWAQELRRRGVPIRGEKLADEVRVLGGPPGPSAGGVSGYFVLGVSDPGAAMAVAESCPHLRHGGRVEVRRIESR